MYCLVCLENQDQNDVKHRQTESASLLQIKTESLALDIKSNVGMP